MHAMTEVVDKDPGLLVVHRSNEDGRKAAALKEGDNRLEELGYVHQAGRGLKIGIHF